MIGTELKHSGFVSIIGAPNAGKSTFMNKLLNTKISIVTEKAQTTRNKINGIYNDADSQIIFVDTPGITPTDFGKLLNNWMNRYSYSAAKESDLIMFFTDASIQHPEKGPLEDDIAILKNLKTHASVILVVNKKDLAKDMRVADTINVYSKIYDFKESVSISAETGDGINELLNVIKNNIPSGPMLFPEGMISDQPEEFMVSEIVREKIFLEFRQEIPYSTAVTVERFENNRQKKIVYINCVIHVSRDSQKGMLIGKGGKMLEKIGKYARLDFEKLFERKVLLKLFVRVEKNWFEKEKLLLKVGFEKDFDYKEN